MVTCLSRATVRTNMVWGMPSREAAEHSTPRSMKREWERLAAMGASGMVNAYVLPMGEEKAEEVGERGVCDFTEPEEGTGYVRGKGVGGMEDADFRLVDNDQGEEVVERGSMTASEVN